MFTFTSLAGARSSSAASISLLEFDGGVKILVDVGWDETFSLETLKELERLAVSHFNVFSDHRWYIVQLEETERII